MSADGRARAPAPPSPLVAAAADLRARLTGPLVEELAARALVLSAAGDDAPSRAVLVSAAVFALHVVNNLVVPMA